MEPVTNIFYGFLKDGRIMALRCGCGSLLFPPRGICPGCGGIAREWVKLSGKGTVLFASVGPHRMMGVDSYLQATVRLEEGPIVSAMLLDDGFDFKRPEEVVKYYEGSTQVMAEVVTNPEGAPAVAFRVEGPSRRHA